jgi:hypothetical protein
MPSDTPPAREPWLRWLPLRGPIELAIWVLAFLVPAAINAAVAWLDARHAGMPLEPWEPVLWESSSAVASLLLLPGLLAFCDRWPLYADNLRRRLPAYAMASVAWSLLHVTGMVLLRKAGYLAMGDHYAPGSLPRMFGYEYLKDIRTFALIVVAAHAYRWVWRRVQGEATLLALPDDVPAPIPAERPERFLVRKLGREFLVPASDIEWLQASGNYVNLRVRGHDYPLRSTIAGIEANLDPARFARIHRSYIVNLDQVASIEPLDTGDARVHLKDGGMLPCSRRQREALRGRAAQ